ncbi:uncharacterized protein F4807DRAFT_407106 [Annulohypoxylon truncatum]|uniref:uncharacterized protein n=1 Tax=Annulohypoxylon truncatum TaxID=327061 RepID=UPI002007A2AF|nr:uncharacterized protein F4807DRAFT_407106 [Annulohypoxylon truncatum]KAI1214218.1 hypothetical protein F4807DRAFT_407106 [Annulohypoxylon truncatum]
MSIQDWATEARSSTEYQSPEKQRLIDVYQALLENKLTPEESAHGISTILEPLIKRNPDDVHIASVWGLFCGIVRHVGGDQAASKRLIELLDYLAKIEVKDDHGNDLKYGAAKFWTNLPSFALMFREYGISIEPDDEMDINDWVAQKTSYFNATSFAAMCLANRPYMSGMAFYIKGNMSDALVAEYETPEPRFRAALHIPAVSAWISIAGQKIYQMCKEEAQGLSMEDWKSWEKGLDQVAENDQVDEEMQNLALDVRDKMRNIQKGL